MSQKSHPDRTSHPSFQSRAPYLSTNMYIVSSSPQSYQGQIVAMRTESHALRVLDRSRHREMGPKQGQIEGLEIAFIFPEQVQICSSVAPSPSAACITRLSLNRSSVAASYSGPNGCAVASCPFVTENQPVFTENQHGLTGNRMFSQAFTENPRVFRRKSAPKRKEN